MRYLKAALVGIVRGIVVTIVVTVAYGTLAVMWLEFHQTCAGNAVVCYGTVQISSVAQGLITFVIGFAAAFAWFVWRQRSVVSP